MWARGHGRGPIPPSSECVNLCARRYQTDHGRQLAELRADVTTLKLGQVELRADAEVLKSGQEELRTQGAVLEAALNEVRHVASANHFRVIGRIDPLSELVRHHLEDDRSHPHRAAG